MQSLWVTIFDVKEKRKTKKKNKLMEKNMTNEKTH